MPFNLVLSIILNKAQEMFDPLIFFSRSWRVQLKFEVLAEESHG